MLLFVFFTFKITFIKKTTVPITSITILLRGPFKIDYNACYNYFSFTFWILQLVSDYLINFYDYWFIMTLYYKMRHMFYKMRQLLYYKMRQKFITKRFRVFITKCDSFMIKCDSCYKRFYYKMRRLFQIATIHSLKSTLFFFRRKKVILW